MSDIVSLLNRVALSLERIECLLANGAAHQVQKEWLTGEEVQQLLSVSKRTLQNYRDTGKIGFSAVGKKFYYHREEVSRMVTEHYQPAFS